MLLAPDPSRATKVNTWRPDDPDDGLTEIGWEPATTKFTAESRLTTAPAGGFSLITLPSGNVALNPDVIVPTTNPTPSIAANAAAFVSPTTFGTTKGGGSPSRMPTLPYPILVTARSA